MMKRLYLSATAFFWLIVAAFWAGSFWLPKSEGGEAVAADKVIRSIELAKHAQQKDCWMAINRNVYDLSTYLPQHPSPPDVIVPWCGKEATQAYVTKTKGRPHSPYADDLLAKYRIGVLAADK